LERRRRRAIVLLERGRTVTQVAETVGASVSSVWTWRETYRSRGPDGLAAKPTPGRPCGLTSKQRQELLRMLARGAKAHGHTTDLWTTQRVADVIGKKFGVDYHRSHVGRILAACGWSCQKPERRALERDEAAIAQWKRAKWPAIKKKRGA